MFNPIQIEKVIFFTMSTRRRTDGVFSGFSYLNSSKRLWMSLAHYITHWSKASHAAQHYHCPCHCFTYCITSSQTCHVNGTLPSILETSELGTSGRCTDIWRRLTRDHNMKAFIGRFTWSFSVSMLPLAVCFRHLQQPMMKWTSRPYYCERDLLGSFWCIPYNATHKLQDTSAGRSWQNRVSQVKVDIFFFAIVKRLQIYRGISSHLPLSPIRSVSLSLSLQSHIHLWRWRR